MVKTLESTISLIETMVKKYITVIKEQAPAIFKQIGKIVKEFVSKIKTSMTTTIADIEKSIQDMYKVIVSSKSFKEIVEFAKKQIATIENILKQQIAFIRQQLADLKNHPLFKKIRSFVAAAIKDLNRNVGKAMEMLRKEIAALRAKVESYMKLLRRDVSALIKQVKEQFEAVRAFIKSLIDTLPAKLSELKQMLMKKLSEMTAQAKKMMEEIMQKIRSSEVYQKMVEYRLKLEKFTNELIAQIKALIEKMKISISVKELKAKVVEFITNAQQVIKKEIEAVQKQIPVIIKTIQEGIKAHIEMIKKQLPELIKKIEQFIKDFFLKSEEFAKETFVQVVESEQVAQLIKMLEELRNFVRDNLSQILNNPSLVQLRNRVDDMVQQTVYYTGQYLQVVQTEVPRMWSEVKDLLTFTFVTALEKYSDIVKAIETSEPMIMITRAVSDILKAVKAQLDMLRMWISRSVVGFQSNPMFVNMNKMAEEVRGDMMRSYGANKNVTMRLIEDVQNILTPYMTQGVSLYVDLYDQLLATSEQLRQAPGSVYTNAASTYDFIVNAPFDKTYTQLVEYTRQLYNSIKTLIADLYANTKSASATIGQDAVDAMVGTLKVIEQKLVQFAEMVQAVVNTIKQTIANIRSGANAEEEVRSLMDKLFEKLDLQSTVDQLCAKDAKLCELAQESARVHRDLMNKYLVRG